MELLEIGLQALEDFHRVLDARLLDVDLLEPAHQGAVLLEILPIFLVGRRADAAQRALRKRRLEQVGGVHRAARRRAGADDSMDLVDEQDRVLVLLDLLHHLLQALLEVAAVARAGQQRAHVEREDGRVRREPPALLVDDLASRPSAIAGCRDVGLLTSSGSLLVVEQDGCGEV